MAVKSYVQINGKLVPKEEAYKYEEGRGLIIMPDIQPFKSPITGEEIHGRTHLRKHMREHGVTGASDYSRSYYETKAKENAQRAAGQTKQDRIERIESIKRAMER